MRNESLLVLCVVCILLGAGQRVGLSEDKSTGEIFAGAFRPGLTTKERVAIVRDVARDHAHSRWGDDAIWTLARVADLQRRPARSIVLRQQLLARTKTPSLEEFTRNRPIYRSSRVHQITFLLERSGHLYSGKPGHVTRFNPLPMALHEELGAAYRELDMPKSALREYQHALRLAPTKSYLARMYRRLVLRLEEKVQQRAKAGGEKDRAESRDDHAS